MPLAQRFRFGVRQRVVLILLIGLLLSLSISGWLALHEQSTRINDEVDRHGTQLTRIISRSLANGVVGNDYHGIQLFLDEVVQQAEVQYVKVISLKGNVMAETHISQMDRSLLRLFQADIRLAGQSVGKLTVGIDSKPIIVQIRAQKNAYISREIGIILFIVLLEFIALSILIVRPLSIISDTIRRNVSNDGVLPNAITLDTHDEFGDIARQFNVMRKQLNQANLALQNRAETVDQQLRETNLELMNKSRELQKLNLNLQEQALTDPLTGIPNRRQFQILMKTYITDALSNGNEFAVLVVDIDRFKTINDRFGHETGDLILQAVANRLSNNIRQADIVCRIGGEEFFVLCKNISENGARQIAEKLRHTVEADVIHVSKLSISVTVSIGIASAGPDKTIDSPDQMYRQADLALYRSKSEGRNQVTHYSDLDVDTIQTHAGQAGTLDFPAKDKPS